MIGEKLESCLSVPIVLGTSTIQSELRNQKLQDCEREDDTQSTHISEC